MRGTVRRSGYLREATIAFGLAKAAARVFSVGRLLAWANKHPRRLSRFRDHEVAWIDWAVATVAARTHAGRTSLPAALATQMMLRRRGIASRLCIGIEPADAITSHAWVEVADGRVVGEIDTRHFVKFSLSAPSGTSATAAT